MVHGHEYVKMATSVIDYIFRDLAISYLKRNDLGQIKPEDLLNTGVKDEMAARSWEGRPHRGHGRAESRAGGKMKPADPGDRREAAGKDRALTGPVAPVPAAAGFAAKRARGSVPGESEREQAAKIAGARLKGYEGDPCPACGSLTLIRNGTCMKCDTCGGTTGCS
jgi:ribonucleoside-diphosphate reductase alpha chain